MRVRPNPAWSEKQQCRRTRMSLVNFRGAKFRRLGSATPVYLAKFDIRYGDDDG